MVYKKPVPEPEWATQGPSPSGFHVPLTAEFVDLWSLLTTSLGLSNNYSILANYLKFPKTGFRAGQNSNAGYRGSYAPYRTSSCANGSNAYTFRIAGNAVNPQYSSYYRTYGNPIRIFKNNPVSPDSSWTVLYQGSGSAGIYHNSSLGLISISGDGATWITIADKNLGATQVWNNGDALSDANCGGLFQRGNNYMFQYSGGVTTSSTQVDASNYGPGNYYSSDTFIKGSGRWDTTDNQNLRGGVDGNVPVS